MTTCIAQLAKAGFAIPRDVLNRPRRAAYEPSEAVEDAWLAVYRDTQKYWALYQLAEKLLDLDDALLTWRHKHVLTVERIIGTKRGTGGTEGVGYLQQTLARRAFRKSGRCGPSCEIVQAPLLARAGGVAGAAALRGALAPSVARRFVRRRTWTRGTTRRRWPTASGTRCMAK